MTFKVNVAVTMTGKNISLVFAAVKLYVFSALSLSDSIAFNFIHIRRMLQFLCFKFRSRFLFFMFGKIVSLSVMFTLKMLEDFF